MAMWFFVLAELSVFAILILAFAVTQRLEPEVFAVGRSQLDSSTGLAMTVSLLTAGLFAALGLQHVRVQQLRRGAAWFCAALWVALLYVGIKLEEYAHLAGVGLGLEYSRFFTLYWVLTGFHFLHVLLGMVIVGWLAVACWRGGVAVSGVESGVLYWHMVDLVWVVLFPVVYVMG